MSIRRESLSSIAFPLVLAIIVIGSLIYINPGFPNFTKGWGTYRDKEVPFVFDHPNSWKFEKKVTRSNQDQPILSSRTEVTGFEKETNEKMLTILLWKGPMVDIAYTCSSKNGANEDCSYIDVNGQIADYFFRWKAYPWMSEDRKGNGFYTITLYEHDGVTEGIVVDIIRSLRLP